jgi:exodeoxyribonuclease VII large subunit
MLLANRRRELEARSAHALKENLRSTRSKLHELQLRLDSADFRAPLAIKLAKIEALDQRIKRAVQRLVERQEDRLALKAGQLNMLSPLAVLGRGYALVKDESDHLVSRAHAVHPGQNLTLRFEDGEVPCQVKPVIGTE